ncbi:MAG: FkbM family methyltransferase [Lachnospiraceae bacterium]|nr:FkbM family methyltransferase [Lachnospiraceae bacterium]
MDIQLSGLPLTDFLLRETRPLYLYGTGDGADKILNYLFSLSITPAGIFVSEEFFRSQTFRGYTCTTLPHLDMTLGPENFVVLVSFGSHMPDLIQRIKDIAATHTTLIPDVPVAGGNIFDEAFYTRHLDAIQEARELWADDASRRVFDRVVDYKLTGKPGPLFDCVTSREEVFSSLLPLSDREAYVDVGAYNGDTLREFLELVPSYDSITALEPDPGSYRKLVKNAGALFESEPVPDPLCFPLQTTSHILPDHRVRLLYAAAGSENRRLTMTTARGRGTRISLPGSLQDSSSGSVPSFGPGKTLDICCLRLEDIPFAAPPTYVKIDVEGSEREALEGFRSTLTSCRPKLNIALYHRSEDLFAIPLLLREWLPGYRFYLRRHDCFPCWDLNLYALEN